MSGRSFMFKRDAARVPSAGSSSTVPDLPLRRRPGETPPTAGVRTLATKYLTGRGRRREGALSCESLLRGRAGDAQSPGASLARAAQPPLNPRNVARTARRSVGSPPARPVRQGRAARRALRGQGRDSQPSRYRIPSCVQVPQRSRRSMPGRMLTLAGLRWDALRGRLATRASSAGRTAPAGRRARPFRRASAAPLHDARAAHAPSRTPRRPPARLLHANARAAPGPRAARRRVARRP